MKKTAIIVAGGSGRRMRQTIPKQFLLLAGKPVLMHTLQKFYIYDSSMQLIVVLPEAFRKRWQWLCREYRFSIPHETVSGGNERYHSVKNGLRKITDAELVAVHDGVRPLVSHQTIATAYKTAHRYQTAVPSVQPAESLRMLTNESSRAVDRASYRMIQTPQVFSRKVLEEAYQQDYTSFFTDDASLVEHAGYTIRLVEGNAANIKITNPQDLAVAEALLHLTKSY